MLLWLMLLLTKWNIDANIMELAHSIYIPASLIKEWSFQMDIFIYLLIFRVRIPLNEPTYQIFRRSAFFHCNKISICT